MTRTIEALVIIAIFKGACYIKSPSNCLEGLFSNPAKLFYKLIFFNKLRCGFNG